uniref:Uncharacterized protein n=1 Tax=Caenorhabditis japonica TaxID=281687 RepID=A0A8R1HLN6_CAEJA
MKIREKLLLNYRCTELAEWNLVQIGKKVEQDFVKALEIGNEEAFHDACCCNNSDQHWEGYCCRIIGADTFKWHAKKYVTNVLYPDFDKYLAVLKEEYVGTKLQKYHKRWERFAPEKFDDPGATKRVMEICGRRSDEKNKMKKEQKINEVERSIEENSNTLGHRITKFRQNLMIQKLKEVQECYIKDH